MHRHHIADKPGVYRSWLRFDLPENPACWLLGHSPRAVVTHWNYGITPSLWIDCRRCGRRHNDSFNDTVRRAKLEPGVSFKDEADALTARRLENLERLGEREFLSGVPRRLGWDGRELVLHHEVHWPAAGKRRAGRDFGIKLHLGNTSSETPIDGHVCAGPFAYYFSVGGLGGRLTGWLGRGHKRDLSLSVHNGKVWWKLWYDGESGNDEHHSCDRWRRPKVWPWSVGRKKPRAWMCLRDGNIELNPADALWGNARPTRRDVGPPVTLAVPVNEFSGDTYLINVQLEFTRWAREHGPAWARRVTDEHFVAEWRTDPVHSEGIPWRNSWKGDGTIASGVRLPVPLPEDWRARVVASIIEDTKARRRRYRYSPGQRSS